MNMIRFSDTIKTKVDIIKYYVSLYTDPLVEIMTTEIYFKPDENAQSVKIKKEWKCYIICHSELALLR